MISFTLFCFFLLGKLATKLFEHMKRQAASLKIQKNYRKHSSWMWYNKLKLSVIVLQTGLRAMAAHLAFRHKKTTKAALLVQVGTSYFHVAFNSRLFLYTLTSQFCRPIGIVIETLNTIRN